MSKQSRNGCGWECCPEGFIEHIKNYRYQRTLEKKYRPSFVGYWWWEFKTLLGFHRIHKTPKEGCTYCEQGECYEHEYFSDEFFKDKS